MAYNGITKLLHLKEAPTALGMWKVADVYEHIESHLRLNLRAERESFAVVARSVFDANARLLEILLESSIFGRNHLLVYIAEVRKN